MRRGCEKRLFFVFLLKFLYARESFCAIMDAISIEYWRFDPMASHHNKNSREQRSKNAVRIVALVACAALLLTAILPVIASGLLRY